MRDYRDETIEKLCNILNVLEDNGCLLDEEENEYHAIVNEYALKNEYYALKRGK